MIAEALTPVGSAGALRQVAVTGPAHGLSPAVLWACTE